MANGATLAFDALESMSRSNGWALSAVPFLLRDAVGTMLLDAGAGVSCVAESCVKKTGPCIIPHVDGGQWHSCCLW